MSASRADPKPVLDRGSFASAVEVSRETLDRLETYADLLNQWQRAVQLVAPSTLGNIWGRHFADSAQIFGLVPASAARWVDLGSGAGFPGLVAALMSMDRGGCRFALVESDTRKAAFLREVVRQTRAPVDIFPVRIELHSTHASVGKCDVISARALAPLDKLLGLALPYWKADTVGLFLKGREAEQEIAAARAKWSFEHRLVPSLSDPEGRIVVVGNLGAKTEG
ncbi:MAG: 16S rRNA (guanine(527)-N(7))-methyltransferase RsmG [Hyphomicrobium sp.]|nr:16S rRNA (guanine(527)-N(7))-methyltransferase RsmG [Hyphomicrobium sp.]